ncbi:MAG: DUF2892 domain-containing protein [Flavobacteriaceae bacterium]|nr:DUF2892 domain-containing protein [Flavobacteriaceae bacterium]
MRTNVGNLDQIFRIVVAVLIGVAYYMEYISGTIGVVLVIAAVVFLLTGIFKFCPLFALFGVSSKK